MRKNLFILFLFSLLILSPVFSQNNALILNGGAYLTLNGGTSGTPVRLIINQPNAAGISQLVANQGWIVSEGEFNYVQWNISSNTGTYTLPYNYIGNYIPFSMQITSAGSAGGNVLFSTYHTATFNNLPVSTYNGVTPIPNLSSLSYVDNSPYMVDRWWVLDATTYATKPASTLSFSFIPTERTAAGNFITAANLVAQPFNSSVPEWNYLMLYGSYAGPEVVNGAVIPVANLFRNWVLVDNTTPLPVKLLSFTANCQNNQVQLNWITASEENNDFFTVEKSADANNFMPIATVNGAGNSNTTIHYSAIDNNPEVGTNYYRLKQTDFDGTYSYSEIVSTNCEDELPFDIVNIININNTLNIYISGAEGEEYKLNLYDNNGRLISNKNDHLFGSMNEVSLNIGDLSPGIYMVTLWNPHGYLTKKIVLGMHQY